MTTALLAPAATNAVVTATPVTVIHDIDRPRAIPAVGDTYNTEGSSVTYTVVDIDTTVRNDARGRYYRAALAHRDDINEVVTLHVYPF